MQWLYHTCRISQVNKYLTHKCGNYNIAYVKIVTYSMDSCFLNGECLLLSGWLGLNPSVKVVGLGSIFASNGRAPNFSDEFC